MSAPGTDWKETKPEGEDELFERYAQILAASQAAIAQLRAETEKASVARALHAKRHVGVLADFTVLGDLPEHARVGLFAGPKTYPAYVRISNGDPKNRADRKPDLRGFAIKVVGVPGTKIIPGMEDAVTQDFLMIPSRALAVDDATEFIDFFQMAQRPSTLIPKMLFRFGPIRTLDMLRAFKKNAEPPASLFAIPYFSGAAIQFGKYAARYAVFPKAPISNGSRAARDYLREDALARMKAGAIELDFRVQFYVDGSKTPIEAHSVEWKESDAPFVTVARLTLHRQDGDSEEGRRVDALIDTLSFDPWHALVEHRPLGNVMRARNAAYRVSTQARKAAVEPTSIP